MRNSMCGECRLKFLDVAFRNGLCPPLVVVFCEKLHTVATSGARRLDGPVIAARDRHVRHKHDHFGILHSGEARLYSA